MFSAVDYRRVTARMTGVNSTKDARVLPRSPFFFADVLTRFRDLSLCVQMTECNIDRLSFSLAFPDLATSVHVCIDPVQDRTRDCGLWFVVTSPELGMECARCNLLDAVDDVPVELCDRSGACVDAASLIVKERTDVVALELGPDVRIKRRGTGFFLSDQTCVDTILYVLRVVLSSRFVQ